ncbi:MAG: AAA family ATPase [Candidatus Moraniibacteriota bacterium]
MRFVLYRFYIGGLLRTLFSPWRRDVSFRTWKGLHPLLFAKTLLNNLISRFLGMVLRLAMLVIGCVVASLMVVVVTLMALAYVGSPLFIVVGAVMLPFSQLIGAMILLFGILGCSGVWLGYAIRKREQLETFDVQVLERKKFFHRILWRLGLRRKALRKEIFADTGTFLQFLATLALDEETYRRAVTIECHADEARDHKSRFWLWENLHKVKPIGKDWHYAYTPHLDHYCVDLAAHDPTEYGRAVLIGRHDEMAVVTVVLQRPTQNSVILVGEPGIGRKTFVHHFASLIRENAFGSQYLDEARVLLFDLSRAMSDCIGRGEDVERALRLLFNEAAYAGNVILVIENIDQYLNGDQERPNLAPLLSEFLEWPNFRVIATAPTNQYHELTKQNEQVLKFFEVIYLRETNIEETFQVLLQKFERLERKEVVFTIKGLDAIVASAERYNWETPFPERAIDLAQEVLLFWQGTNEDFITPATVNGFMALRTGMPIGVLGAAEKEKLLKLETLLHERVVGQNEAVEQVAEAMRKARAGFGDEKRPLGSFIFFGSTGVGKTETAKALAESYFGSEDDMIRLDMSEYQTEEAVDRLIGSREMRVQGRLTSLAKEHPFSILLLDEIEKANPKALDLFLQILDEGYVTDSDGEKINFRNMIIIATSNAGAALIKQAVEEGVSTADIRKQIMDFIVAHDIFRLEFLNRFDSMVFFEPLQADELLQVALLKLKKFALRLKQEKNIVISFAPDVAQKIVERGYEPVFGARSLNRYIEDAIEDMIVKKIIAGEIASGGSLLISGDEL